VGFKKGQTAWNKGLSADPNSPKYDARVAKYGRGASLSKKGRPSPFKGKTKENDLRAQKISKTHKRRPSKLRGIPRPDDVKQKIRNSHLGKKHSAEHRLANSAARKKWYLTHDHVNKGKTMTDSQKMKIKQTRNERIKMGAIKSTLGYKHTKESKIIMKEKAITRKGKYPKTNTSIEITLQNMLKENNIQFKIDEPILNIARPDIFIPPILCIFADGEYWHNYPEGRETDRRQTKILEENGFVVLRFWGREIHGHPKECLQKILDEINKNEDRSPCSDESESFTEPN
jgi:very-short-patch-repair endonuclease